MSDRIKVTINVVPVKSERIIYDARIYGKTRSTEDNINVIKINDGYSVVFDEEVFVKISVNTITMSIMKMFAANLKGNKFTFELIYHYKSKYAYALNMKVAEHVIAVDNWFNRYMGVDVATDSESFIYQRHPMMGELLNEVLNEKYTNARREEELRLKKYENPLYEDDDDDDDYDEDEIDDEDKDVSVDDDWWENFGKEPANAPNGIFGMYESMKDFENDKDYSNVSETFRNCEYPKKYISKHGVLVAKSKQDIYHDTRVLEYFLDEFVPGDSAYLEKFRRKVASRWMSTFAISAKELKRNEKKYKKEQKKDKKKNKAQRKEFMQLTKFAVNKFPRYNTRYIPARNDRWNDPTR